MKKYPYIARSNSDPNGELGGLGFTTIEEAESHCNVMNSLIDVYPNGGWNIEFWKSKPSRWEVHDG